MSTGGTLLCIHRDPGQLKFLQEHGYELVTAANGDEGLRLFRSRIVDAIVIEHQMGRLDSATIASEIRQARPEVPIVLLTDDLELPSGTLKSVDALVAGADGQNHLLASVHFVLNVKRRAKARFNLKPSRRARDLSLEDAFTPETWNKIRKSEIQF